MNTFQLTCFLTVAETLNFAKAAERLNITQPAVTHQIRSLEDELNAKLFVRTTRRVELTPAGYLFLGDAKSMVAISVRAKKRFENPLEQVVSPLSVGCYSATDLFMLPPVFRKLAEIYPNVQPRLQVVPFPHLYRLLEEEDVEVIIGFKENGPKKPRGVYRELRKIPIACVCPKGHPLCEKSSIEIDELEGERLIAGDPMTSPRNIVALQGQLMGGRSPADFYICESTEAAMVLTSAGFGVTVLPDFPLPPELSLDKTVIENLEPMSFGLYYKTLQGNALLKDFICIMEKSMDKIFA